MDASERQRLRLMAAKALVQNPQNVEAHHLLATLALPEGQLDEAERHWSRALRWQPGFAAAHYGLANVCQAKGRFLDALGHFRAATRHDPDTFDTYDTYKSVLLCLQAAAGVDGTLTAPEPAGQPGQSISVIVCSIDPAKTAFIRQHYSHLLAGAEHELILIDDARSLAEGYNRGISRARGEVLVFSHDDIEIPDDGFAWKLCRQFEEFDVLGFAGTSHLTGPIWTDAGWPHLHGLVAHQPTAAEPLSVSVFGLPRSPQPRLQALDGLFLAARRPVFDKLRFDEETFTGFHLYDLDFSYRAFLAGLRLGVCEDTAVIHRSTGRFDSPQWRHSADAFVKKHQLPPSTNAQPNFHFPVPDRNGLLRVTTLLAAWRQDG